MKMQKKRIVSLLIAMSMMVSLIGSNLVSAEEVLIETVTDQIADEKTVVNEETSVETAENEYVYSDGDLDIFQLANAKLADFEIPEIISLKDIKTNMNVNRLYLQENDEYTAIFQNKDGSKTMYLFNEPIKYTDKYGVMRDKQTELTSSVDSVDKSLNGAYIYVNEENDVNTFFPSVLSQETGMLVKNDKYEIEFSPKTEDDVKASASEIVTKLSSYGHKKDYVEYDNVFGENSTIQYSASINGMKEDIVLNSYEGINEFSFTITTNGLKVVDVGDYFVLVDPATNEEVGGISEVIVFDSSRISKTIVEQDCVVDYSAVEEEANNKYTITITISEEFLKSEAVYPVTIDPSIALAPTGSGTSKTIIDTPIYSGKATTNYGSYSIGTAGYQDSTLGIGRILLRFPGLENHSVFPFLRYSEIKSATLYMTEGTGNSATSNLELRVPNISNWAETYPTFANANTSSSSVYGSATISSSGTIQFDITEFAKQWSLGFVDIKKGIMIKNKNETSTSYRRSFYMSEYSSSKPRIVIKWEPLKDGMAYMLKTVTDGANDGMCLTGQGYTLKKREIEFNENEQENEHIEWYSNPSQIWSIKLSQIGGYILYRTGMSDSILEVNYAISSTYNNQLTIAQCSSETNPYYCWDIVKVSKSRFALKNKVTGYWVASDENDNMYLSGVENDRQIFTLTEDNHELYWDGTYQGQQGHYQLNVVLHEGCINETSDFTMNDVKNAIEQWNGITDKITVSAYLYELPENAEDGLLVDVYSKEFGTFENTVNAVFIPNGTYNSSTSISDDQADAIMNGTVERGVIFVNLTNSQFSTNSREQKLATLTHEVGHALFLQHTGYYVNQYAGGATDGIYTACSIMQISNLSTLVITPYDKSNLIKKWSEMP
ncbi:MAG: DNRLRE domain-containing protein [Ruminococcaceae bacterium]|nr:DNRLRE domain-containing protein [Oscillospiraceae bacterium]